MTRRFHWIRWVIVCLALWVGSGFVMDGLLNAMRAGATWSEQLMGSGLALAGFAILVATFASPGLRRTKDR